MSQIVATAEVVVNPTEDPEKVKRAIQNVIGNPPLKLTQMDGKSLMTARIEGWEGLTNLHRLLRRERILDSARRVLLRGVSGNEITFYLNKQVAYVGRVSFSVPEAESPLGPIKVVITCDDVESLIDWLAPSTVKKGRSRG